MGDTQEKIEAPQPLAEETTNAPATSGEVPSKNTDEVEGTDAQQTEDDAHKDDPDWKDAELERARKDAAKYRTSLRSLEEKFKDAKTLEEFEAARQEWDAERLQLMRENVAEKARLPEKLAKLLQGETREELEAHAKELAEFVVAPPVDNRDLRGGLDPNTDDDDTANLDPRELAKRMRR